MRQQSVMNEHIPRTCLLQPISNKGTTSHLGLPCYARPRHTFFFDAYKENICHERDTQQAASSLTFEEDETLPVEDDVGQYAELQSSVVLDVHLEVQLLYGLGDRVERHVLRGHALEDGHLTAQVQLIYLETEESAELQHVKPPAKVSDRTKQQTFS